MMKECTDLTPLQVMTYDSFPQYLCSNCPQGSEVYKSTCAGL